MHRRNAKRRRRLKRRRVERIKEKLRLARLERQKSDFVPRPFREPRYDEVFFKGTEWLNTL